MSHKKRGGPMPWYALLGVLAVALGLRLWGVYFGLPHVYHPDEGFEVYRALRLGMGGYDFDRVAKGGYYLLLFVEFCFLFVFKFVTGAVAGVSDFARYFLEHPESFWKIGRVSTALLGTATVALLAWQGNQLQGARMGLLAAWFLATSFQHVVDSHTITVDVPMTILTLGSIVLVVEDVCGRARLKPVLFALLAAYAIMNKLPAVLLFLPYFVGAWMRGGLRREGGLLTWRTWIPPFLAAAFYLIANPGFLVNLQQTLDLVSHTVGGHTEKSDEYGEVPKSANLWFYYGKTLFQSQGPVVMVLAAVGVGLSFMRRRRGLLLHLLFAVVYYALISGTSSSHLYYSRYVLPILPALCLLAAFAIDELIEALKAPRSVSALATAGIGLVAMAGPTLACIRWDQKLSRPDTRTAAAEWVESNVPNGASILLEGFPEEAAQLSIPLRSRPENVQQMIATLRTSDPGKAKFWEMKLEAEHDPRYDLQTIRHFEDWETISEVNARGVEWLVLRREFFVPGIRKETKFLATTMQSRYAFYEELAAHPEWTRREAFDPNPQGQPGYTMEIWKRTLPSPSRPGIEGDHAISGGALSDSSSLGAARNP